MESDWRKFREMVPHLRERWLAEQNARVVAKLIDPEKSPTERFWNAEKEIRNIESALNRCLVGHSRSKMFYFMVLMRGEGMLRPEDLTDFSEALREQLNRVGMDEEG